MSGDEIKFTRNVGDVATETFVAKRVKDKETTPEPKTESEASTNTPAKQP